MSSTASSVFASKSESSGVDTEEEPTKPLNAPCDNGDVSCVSFGKGADLWATWSDVASTGQQPLDFGFLMNMQTTVAPCSPDNRSSSTRSSSRSRSPSKTRSKVRRAISGSNLALEALRGEQP